MKDIKLYNELMTKGMADKLFFIDKLNELFNKDITEEISCIVDFGCADGTMSRELHKFYPKALIIGYDESATQIELAEFFGQYVWFYIFNLLRRRLNRFTTPCIDAKDFHLFQKFVTLFLQSTI